MVKILRDIERQKLTEEALIVANQMIATQAEQITVQAEKIVALTQSVALLTTKIEELQAENAKLKRSSKNSVVY